METYNFIHLDGNKEYNSKLYEKDFKTKLEAFEYL